MRNQLKKESWLWEQHLIPPPCPAKMLLHPFSLLPQKGLMSLNFYFLFLTISWMLEHPCGVSASLLVLILVDFGSGRVALGES